MSTLVMTVPHSGTHFILKFLVAVLGLDGRSDLNDYNIEGTRDFTHTHPNVHDFEQFEYELDDVFDCVIMTLRHPHKTVQTGKWAGNPSSAVAESWQLMVETQEKISKKLFLVIDGPEENRYPQLMAIANHFVDQRKRHNLPSLPALSAMPTRVLKYANDWNPVNQSITEDDISTVVPAVEVYEQWLL